MRLRMKKFNIMGFTEKCNFKWLRGGDEKPIYRRELPGKGDLGQFADLSVGNLAKKRGVVFLRRGGGVMPLCTLRLYETLSYHHYSFMRHEDYSKK